MDKEKRARKMYLNTWMNLTNQSNLWTSTSCQHPAQRRIKDHLAYGRGIMQAISQIYGRIKLAKEIPFIDELYL